MKGGGSGAVAARSQHCDIWGSTDATLEIVDGDAGILRTGRSVVFYADAWTAIRSPNSQVGPWARSAYPDIAAGLEIDDRAAPSAAVAKYQVLITAPDRNAGSAPEPERAHVLPGAAPRVCA